MKMRIKKTNLLVALLCVIFVWQFSSAAYIHAKAKLAQHLVEKAWINSKKNNSKLVPWPWADTYPVARMQVPSQNIEQMILSGISGRTMAFGPGWMNASVMPGEDGVSVISGHRDTHFKFMKNLRIGDEINIESLSKKVNYRIIDMNIVDSRYKNLSLELSDSLLILITCYPFEKILAGGPLRYVVTAEKTKKTVIF